ncbi:MAG TPA: outer membrane beta-barrel protein [Gemmatimonadales bacterium]|nr:outer membrane beta-barrel protein [Gemmatimonadales bacterium]
MSRLPKAAGAVVVALIVAAATARAQGMRPQYGVGASVAIPAGAYHATASGEGFNTGWQGMGLVAFTRPDHRLGLRVDVAYGGNSGNATLDSTLTTNLGQATTEKAKLLGGNVDLTYGLGSSARVQPYLLTGLGVYHLTISVTSGGATTDDTATKLAWNVGGGATYRLGGVAVFVEARYVTVGAAAGFPRTTFLPITAGVRFGGE